MFETAARIFVAALEVYAVIGVMFALAFVSVGVGRLDPQAQGAPLGFRLLIFPGSAALWPLLAWRWAQGIHAAPIEHNPHRDAAR